MTAVKKSGRRPAHESTPGRQQIWEAVRQTSGVFTVTDIADKTGANRKTITDYLACLTAGAYATHTPGAAGQAGSYELVKDTGHHAPRLRRDGTVVVQGEANQQMWCSMTILKTFTYRDLIETASIDIKEHTAKSYCAMLLATGYLKIIEKAAPSRDRIARYRLIRNKGPKPPQVQRVKQIYDPNTATVYPMETRS